MIFEDTKKFFFRPLEGAREFVYFFKQSALKVAADFSGQFA